MKVFIACDHRGFKVKIHLKKKFSHINWIDLGCDSEDSVDYPDYADKLAREMKEKENLGVLICGSGQGMAIRANKYPHIRAALCSNEAITRLCRNTTMPMFSVSVSSSLPYPFVKEYGKFFLTQSSSANAMRRG